MSFPLRPIAAVTFILAATSVSAFDHDHKIWSQQLAKYTDAAGSVKYTEMKKDAGAKDHPFNGYLASLQQVTKQQYNGWTRPQKMAFLINAYNAFTIKLILDHYPVKSIKDIGGWFTKPWRVKFFSLLDGTVRSLDPIEHDLLRPEFKDYRIHAAVNCASLSCPPLRRSAYTGSGLDAELDEQMRLWLADPGRNSWTEGKVQISKIFDWYEGDFEKWGGGVGQVLLKYAPESARGAIKAADDFDYLDYDWNLNKAGT